MAAAETVAHETGDKGLRSGALGFISSVVIGVASTAPGYSLSANGTWFGIAQAFIIGIGFLLVGVVLMFVWQRMAPEFFRRRPEVVDDWVAVHGAVPMPEAAVD